MGLVQVFRPGSIEEMKQKRMKIKLGVNVDHVATLRQARGTAYPSPLEAAQWCVSAGAQGITVHLREDRRHIQPADVLLLLQKVPVPINLEMANAPEIVAFALKVRPPEVCLVPEKRQELTTEGGLDVAGQMRRLHPTVRRLAERGIAVSLFIAPETRQIEAAAELGVPVVELHTGAYCEARGLAARRELDRLVKGARLAHAAGLQVNAGHGIHLENAAGILQIPFLDTLNIGHSIVARAVLTGMKAAVREMLRALAPYAGGRRG